MIAVTQKQGRKNGGSSTEEVAGFEFRGGKTYRGTGGIGEGIGIEASEARRNRKMLGEEGRKIRPSLF